MSSARAITPNLNGSHLRLALGSAAITRAITEGSHQVHSAQRITWGKASASPQATANGGSFSRHPVLRDVRLYSGYDCSAAPSASTKLPVNGTRKGPSSLETSCPRTLWCGPPQRFVRT
jgi:hypothetical protein